MMPSPNFLQNLSWLVTLSLEMPRTVAPDAANASTSDVKPWASMVQPGVSSLG